MLFNHYRTNSGGKKNDIRIINLLIVNKQKKSKNIIKFVCSKFVDSNVTHLKWVFSCPLCSQSCFHIQLHLVKKDISTYNLLFNLLVWTSNLVVHFIVYIIGCLFFVPSLVLLLLFFFFFYILCPWVWRIIWISLTCW